MKSTMEDTVWPVLSPSERASVRSQSGPLASIPFTTFPIHRVTRMDSQPFRVLLLWRLRLPLPLSAVPACVAVCLDVLGHHRAACGVAGVLSRRGYAVESAVGQICRESGARVSTKVMVRNLDIATGSADGRRLEVVAEGLSLFGGVQLAIDATLVAAHHGDGRPLRRADTEDGVALKLARKRKVARYPELCRADGRARLVVIAGEVGWRWSRETKTFLQCLADKAETAPKILKASVQVAWYRRWSSILTCAAAKAFATSLLERRGDPGAGGRLPSVQEVRVVASTGRPVAQSDSSSPSRAPKKRFRAQRKVHIANMHMFSKLWAASFLLCVFHHLRKGRGKTNKNRGFGIRFWGRRKRPLGFFEVQEARYFRTGCGTQNRRVFPIAPSVSVESVMRSMPDSCRHLQTLATVQHGSIAMPLFLLPRPWVAIRSTAKRSSVERTMLHAKMFVNTCDLRQKRLWCMDWCHESVMCVGVQC